jgi:hypothetical protein
MRRFKQFLNEISAGPVAPTLTAGPNWQFPTSQSFNTPTSFRDIAKINDMFEKPLLAALHKAQYLVQNIVSDPSVFGITNPATQIVGTPRTGGNINGLSYRKMISAGASRGLRFLPTEFESLERKGVFTTSPPVPPSTDETVMINLKTLYDVMNSEIASDVAKGRAAGYADDAISGLNNLVQPGNGAMTLGRHQYNV